MKFREMLEKDKLNESEKPDVLKLKKMIHEFSEMGSKISDYIIDKDLGDYVSKNYPFKKSFDEVVYDIYNWEKKL